MRHTFHTEQWLPYAPEIVFAFFANPENLPRLMPPWQKARIEEAAFAPPPPRPASTFRQRGIAAGAGTRMTISFRAFPYCPVRIPWEAEISEFVWNDHFCDVQHRGPFRYWKHCHHIWPESRAVAADSAPTAGTLLTDHVEYELPFGPLGDIGNLLVGQFQLRRTFRYRQKRTSELLPLAAAR